MDLTLAGCVGMIWKSLRVVGQFGFANWTHAEHLALQPKFATWKLQFIPFLNSSGYICYARYLTIRVSVCVCVSARPIIYEQQQMNSLIGSINVFKKPGGTKTEGSETESKEKWEKQSKRAEDPLSVFFVAEESSPVALKRGIILSSKQTFGYSWLAERLRGLKEDTVRMGLNIKVNLRSAGLGHESTNAETQRSQRSVQGASGDQLSGGWTALWMTPGWGPPKGHSGEWYGVVSAPAPQSGKHINTQIY